MLAAALACAGYQWASSEEAGAIKKLSPELDRIIPAHAKVERVTSGPELKWTEGPVWVTKGFLLFSDVPSSRILKWTPGKPLTTFMQASQSAGKPDGKSIQIGTSGMVLDTRGRLTVAGNARRDIWRLEIMDEANLDLPGAVDPDKARITVLADSYQGKRLNSPHDLVYRSDGALYFTDPPFGLPTQSDKDPAKETPVNGVYRLDEAVGLRSESQPHSNRLELMIKNLPQPSGIAFAPNERYLYVSNSGPKKLWMRYPSSSSGSLDVGEVFYDASANKEPGVPGGIKVDQNGNVYSAGPGGVWIFSPEGKHLGTIQLPKQVSNITFGDADGKTLYITAQTSIYRVRVNILGLEKKWLAVPS